MADLVTIGSFSELCGLSAKVLRTYGEEGLLEPAAIDRTNGYRYYDRSQVERARLIGLLRQAGIPLAEIRRVLDQPDRAVFDDLQDALDNEVSSRRSALAAARRVAGDLPSPRSPSIEHTDQEVQNPMTMTMHAAQATDLGRVRDMNQDAVAVTDRLVVLADGFGPSGTSASADTVALISDAFATTPTVDGLGAAIERANDALLAEAKHRDAGTTVVALGIGGTDANQVVAGHVGDSRLYRLRSGRFEQLTTDHSVVAELLADGTIRPEEWASHPQRHILTSALGAGHSFIYHLQAFDGRPGDRYLLCSDGLSTELAAAEIAKILQRSDDVEETAAALVGAAVAHGGNDNVTVAVVDLAAADRAADPR